MKFARRLVIAMLAFGLSATAAHAAPITYYFSGSFFGIDPNWPALQNTAFFGSFTYDPTISPDASGSNSHDYLADASIAVQTVLGGFDSSAADMNLVWDSDVPTWTTGGISPADALYFYNLAAPPISVFGVYSLLFADGTNAPADDPFGANLSGLPMTLPLSQMDVAEFVMFGDSRSEIAVGHVTCLSTDPEACSTSSPVPEPASLTLLGLGLAGMAGRRWRQRKRG